MTDEVKYILLAVGFLVLWAGIFVGLKLLGVGHLPGDIVVKKKNFTFYFPLGTSFLISLILTVLLNFLIRRR